MSLAREALGERKLRRVRAAFVRSVEVRLLVREARRDLLRALLDLIFASESGLEREEIEEL